MHRRHLFAALALAASTALAGCVVPPQQVSAPVIGPVVVPQQRVCDTRFDVVNQSGRVVREFYFSSSALASFGRDQLGQNVLQPGQSVRFVAANPGNYDFRAVFMNGQQADLYRINVCTATRITITNRGLIAQ